MLTNSAVFEIFKEISSQTTPAVVYNLKAELILPDGSVYPFTTTDGLTTHADYATKVGHHMILTVGIGPMEYKTWLAPNKDHFRIRLTRELMDEAGAVVHSSRAISNDYDGYLLNPQDLDILSNSRANDDNQLEYEASGLVSIHFQLVEQGLNEVRRTSTSGIRLRATMDEVLCGELSEGLAGKSISTLRSPDYKGLRGVDIVKSHNQHRYKHVMLKSGTRLCKLATYLQEKYGINGTGIGQYYQNQNWFIYPLYELQRYATTKDRLTIVLVPQDEASGLERTFIKKGGELIIMCTGDRTVIDNTENIVQNIGDGIRFNRASDLETMFSHDRNKATSRLEDVQKAFSVDNRRSGSHNIRYTEDLFTDNHYRELSRISSINGQQLSLNWESSFAPWLRPAMPVKILYKKNGKIVELLGSVLGHATTTAKATGMMTDNNYFSNTKLIVHAAKNNSVQA